MSYLLNRISISPPRFISALSISVENKSHLRERHEKSINLFNPSQIFSDSSKSRPCTIRNAEIIHAQVFKTAILQSDIFIANSLLDWYCKCSAMDCAVLLFDEIPYPNLISFNIKMSGYNQNSLFKEAWKTFCTLRLSGFIPTEFTYGSVLSACAALQSPLFGDLVHSLTIKTGFFLNGFVHAGMINLMATTCSFHEALRVFQDVSCENVVCWNVIISAAIKNGENWIALDLFCQMIGRFLVPNSFTLSTVLTACATLEELEMGKEIQGWVIKTGTKDDIFVGTSIVDLYAKCGEMDESAKEFLHMPVRNVVVWSSLLSGFVQNDDSISALQLFKEMRKKGEEINNYTVTSLLTACAKPTMQKEAAQIHSWILKSGFYSNSAVGSSLIKMYSKIGGIDSSEAVFCEMEMFKNIEIWAVMISTSANYLKKERAIDYYLRMLKEGLKPDKFCSSSVLSIIDSISLGKQVHCYTTKTGLVFDVSVGSSILIMYCKYGAVEESYEVFEQIIRKDNVSWASMIAAFTEHGSADQAIHLFREMLIETEDIKPDQTTLSSILHACSSLHLLQKGKEIHGYSFRSGFGRDVLVGSALVNMYSKCGSLDLAIKAFKILPRKDQISYCSLISGFAQNGYLNEALALFSELRMVELELDSFTVSSVLGVVTLLSRLDIGSQLHSLVAKIGLDSETSVGSSLVTMYSKCGSIGNCCNAFDQITNPDLICWTAMIASYAHHGKGKEALRVYKSMIKEGIQPDSVTFITILSACSHNGLIEEAFYYFNSMIKDYEIEPNYRHYACMVDILSRGGRLEEAEEFIEQMPIKADALIWGTLLAACKVHGNVEIGRRVGKRVIELEPCEAGAYVSLSNIWADLGQWEEVSKIRTLMKVSDAMKEPGSSFV